MKATLSLREHQRRRVPEMHFTDAVIREAERIDFQHEDFSWKSIMHFAHANFRKLGEANPASAFSQLFRAGAQTIANTWYERTLVEYPTYVAENPSKGRQEYYDPLFGSQFPTLTEPGEPYSENIVNGLDVELINAKYMGGESFPREFFDDDKTGQINTRTQRLGESARLREELEIAGKLTGKALTVGNVTVAATKYARVNSVGSTITGPYSTTFYGTRGGVNYGNRLTTFAQLSMSGIRTALQALRLAFDPLGVPLAVRPDVLVVSPTDQINARTLLNSTYYPGVPGLSGQTASGATSGSLTGGFADNILKGMLDLAENIFLPLGAWNVGVKKRGLIFQRRDPLEVVQEAQNSGQSFNTDTQRLRSRGRWVADWIDASFWFQGNDGTASISQ